MFLSFCESRVPQFMITFSLHENGSLALLSSLNLSAGCLKVIILPITEKMPFKSKGRGQVWSQHSICRGWMPLEKWSFDYELQSSHVQRSSNVPLSSHKRQSIEANIFGTCIRWAHAKRKTLKCLPSLCLTMKYSAKLFTKNPLIKMLE